MVTYQAIKTSSSFSILSLSVLVRGAFFFFAIFLMEELKNDLQGFLSGGEPAINERSKYEPVT